MIKVLPLYVCIYIYIPVYNSKGSYSWEGSYLGGGEGGGGVNPYILQEYIVSHNLSQCEFIVS
jgi:hypothetical protein